MLTYLIVMSLSVPLFAVALWFLIFWSARVEEPIRRLVVWFVFVLAVMFVPVAQLVIFRRMTGLKASADPLMFLWMLGEGIAVLVLIFYYAFKIRSKFVR